MTDADTMKIFFEKFYGRLPVVIDGALDSWPAMQWSTAVLSRKCPKAQLQVYAYEESNSSTNWAGLREASTPLLREYFGDWFGKSHGTGQPPYGLEMSIRNECPEALEDIRIPAFFSDDMLVKYYRKAAWPTLITGPAGTRSGLHRDSHNFPFWMALFVGKKHWRIFLDGEKALGPLYQTQRNSFKFDAFRPDFFKYPSLEQATVYDHELEAGQLIYIPNGAPHTVENIEDTIAISGNFLDGRSAKPHLEGTCMQPLWSGSSLCWKHNDEFQSHKVASLEELKELSYFEFAGFVGSGDWCKSYLSDLRDRASRHPDWKRNVPIVEEYCTALA
jgi:hypothetical protein